MMPFFAALALAAACSRKQEPQPSSTAPIAATAPTASSTSTGTPGTAKDIAWTDPAGWQRLPPTSMRKATYKIPAVSKDAEEAELAVFYFGAKEGGSTEANIQRWVSQFPDVPPGEVHRTERSSNGMKQTIVEVEGTYSGSGMPNTASGPKANYRMAAAVVETPLGNYFFKLTGPKNTVQASRDAYLAMLNSVRAN
jgi:hypothetical protein